MIQAFSRAARMLALFAVILTVAGVSCTSEKTTPRILVFSKTAGYRHDAIPEGIQMFQTLGKEKGFLVDTTENASKINEENLRNYHAVIFLNTTMDVLNKQQQNDFERFIQAGGGFVGIHAAADTEYDWPWYNGLVGAYFQSHPNNPNVRTAEFYVTDHNHPASDSLPERFTRSDEFYNYRSIKRDLINVLVKIDESTYEGGTNGDDHPISWYHEYDGGRAFYTGMGHTKESYSEPLFIDHVWGGLQYVLGGESPKRLNYTLAKTERVPDENRFTKVVLAEGLDEPVEFVILKDNRVLFIERKGAIKLYTPEDGAVKTIYELEVSHKYNRGVGEAEDGLLGLGIDPNFETNNWIYLYYSKPGDKPVNILTRWDFVDNKLIPESEKVLLEVEVQRDECCHTGGSIDWDADGNLYLSTGDNTNPHATGYAPIDERPGREPWDAQKGSANTNDLRGSILRIKPQPDGTYAIPEGNLFPPGTPNTRPEIYVMGARNPYRISVDKKTGYLYWGDVGPDANSDSVGYGPKGHDEINQARKAGFFGWPYFLGDNQAYYDYDFATGKSGPQFDPQKPINESPSNTGLRELPPAQPAFIWYPYERSRKFPLVGTGGRTAMAGPVFYAEDFKGAARAFPDYYDGKLFIYEWVRGWIMAVTMDEEGNFLEMEEFMPSHKFSNPMDMAFGPDGDLYLLEYGTGWFQKNDNSRLVRIEYNGGNRKPQVHLAVDKPKGATPHTVAFNTAGTQDFDRDKLTYKWEITSADGKNAGTLSGENPTHTFNEPGVYTVKLTVTDTHKASSSMSTEIHAGNEPPEVSFELTGGNKTFFFPNTDIEYAVKVTDKEDGSLADGTIDPQAVSVTIDYLAEGYDQVAIAMGHQAADEAADRFAAAKSLMAGSDCMTCHQVDRKSIGPMYIDVAKKYKDDPNAREYLADKIINGGSGVWGEVAMAAHPDLTKEQTAQMVEYILSLADQQALVSLPVAGKYRVEAENKGVLIARAAYTDRGANGVPPIRKEQTLILRAPTFSAATATVEDGVNKFRLGDNELMIGTHDGAYVGFEQIDLTNVGAMTFTASAPGNYGFVGGVVEVRVDSPTGPVIGTSSRIAPGQGAGQQAGIQVRAAIQKTEGMHDLYLVYRNPGSAEGANLFVLVNVGLEFDQKATASR